MKRLVVVHCTTCNREREFFCDEDDRLVCKDVFSAPPHCYGNVEQHWWKRRSQLATVWHPEETAVVFKKPDGTYSFPGRNDKPTPAGCERIEIRSDRDMARLEAAAGVRSEARWFDRGSGRGHDGDETMRPVPRPADPELLKFLGRRAN